MSGMVCSLLRRPTGSPQCRAEEKGWPDRGDGLDLYLQTKGAQGCMECEAQVGRWEGGLRVPPGGLLVWQTLRKGRKK